MHKCNDLDVVFDVEWIPFLKIYYGYIKELNSWYLFRFNIKLVSLLAKDSAYV